jgi:hypothetical protein
MSDAPFQVSGPNSEPAQRANRLREAVRAAGGNQAVSQRSGVPLRNLTRYIAGEEMKATALIGLAEACNVSLDWLATGRGPMQPGTELAAAPPTDPLLVGTATRTSNIFGILDMDRLATAYDLAVALFRAKGKDPGKSRELMQVTTLIYDDYLGPGARPLALLDLLDDPK